MSQRSRVYPGPYLLVAEGRGALNFLYKDASTDALVKALDPEWPGPLPHTVQLAELNAA